MAEIAGVLESVLRTLLAEEEQLSVLIVLAVQEQEALVAADHAEVGRIGDAMIAIAGRLEALGRERESLLGTIGCDELTLDALLPLADDHGVQGFVEARQQLLARALELRSAQESNARLLLSAMRLQEKWMNMFSSLAITTYGSDGLQEQHRGRQFVSRSA